MATVIPIGRSRLAARQNPSDPQDSGRRPAFTFMLAFGGVAFLMSLVVVAVAARSWGDVGTLLVFIFVIALAKIAVGSALFITMMRADVEAERAEQDRLQALQRLNRRFRGLPPMPGKPGRNQTQRRQKVRKTSAVVVNWPSKEPSTPPDQMH